MEPAALDTEVIVVAGDGDPAIIVARDGGQHVGAATGRQRLLERIQPGRARASTTSARAARPPSLQEARPAQRCGHSSSISEPIVQA